MEGRREESVMSFPLEKKKPLNIKLFSLLSRQNNIVFQFLCTTVRKKPTSKEPLSPMGLSTILPPPRYHTYHKVLALADWQFINLCNWNLFSGDTQRIVTKYSTGSANIWKKDLAIYLILQKDKKLEQYVTDILSENSVIKPYNSSNRHYTQSYASSIYTYTTMRLQFKPE